jgi:CubicO group peptidase (beta-lactamase class C family)
MVLRPLLLLLLLLLALLFAAPLSAQLTIDTVSYHGVSHASHQNSYNSLSGQGYRLTSLAVAGGWANAHYSAVWVRQSGPPWVSAHGMTLAQYYSQAASWESQGYRAKILTASGSGSDKVFAAMFVQDGLQVFGSVEIASSAWGDHVAGQRHIGRRMVSCAVYGSSLSPTYAAVFEHDTSDIGWGFTHSLTPTLLSQHLVQWVDTEASPSFLAMNGSSDLLSGWRDVRLGAWSVRSNRTAAQLTADKTTLAAQGLIPLCIAAGGSGSNARFSAFFVERLTPLPRTMTRTGQAIAGMQGVDTWVENFLQSHNVRNAAVAVTNRGRLVHARGFTWGEAGQTPTQPTSPFRIGSISKSLTGMLAHQVIQSGANLSMNTTYANQLGITTYSPGAQNATLHSLLTHSAGMNEPPIRQLLIANWWASQTGTAPSLPPDESVVGRYTMQNGIYQPGRYSYSNASLTMVGQMIEQATGQSYMQALTSRLTTPLGITRLYRQKAPKAQLAPGEVHYFPENLDLAAGNLDVAEPRLAPQYNDQFWDSAGGIVTSAVDLARIVAGTMQIGADSPVFSLATQAAIKVENTIPQRDSADTAGVTDSEWHWYADGMGRKVDWHNGGQRGTSTFTLFREDLVGITLLINADAGINGGALMDLTNSVTWDHTDQFPNYGLPSFPRRPELNPATIDTLPNLTKLAFTFSGWDLDDVTSVQFGNDFLVPTLSTAWEGGYIEHAGDTLLKVHPPQGLQPGTYSVRAFSAQGGSSTQTVTVTFSPSFRTMAQDYVVHGNQPFSVYVSRGPNSNATFVALAISDSTAPSVFPGLVSLDLGNGFSQIVVSDFRQCDPFARLARWDFTGMNPLTELHVQAVALDLAEVDPWPLPTTTVITVDRL